MPKQNNVLARMEARLRAQYDYAFERKINMVMQMGQDAAMIAANEMSQLMHDDQKDDPDFEYAKAKIDQRIRAIIGDEIFVPWEVRYGQVPYKEE